jgi:RNA recognition motif-containing protein
MMGSKKKANSIFIRGISVETETDDLRGVFEKYGPVYDIYVPRDYNTNKARGFAYVEYENQEDAEKAMDKIEYLEIAGHQAVLEWAKGDRKTPREMSRQYNRVDRSPSPRRRYDSPPRGSYMRQRSPYRYGTDRYGPPRHYRRRSRSPGRYYSPEDRSRGQRYYTPDDRSRTRSPPRFENSYRRDQIRSNKE